MSMEVRTVLELIQVFTAYCICILLCPYIVFHYYLREKTLAEKFICCTLIGNFYIMNVVFVIFLLHIPGRLTLYLFTIVPAVIAWMRINRPAVREFFIKLYTQISRLFLGEAKFRTITELLLTQPRKRIHRIIKAVFSHITHHFIEWVVLTGLLSFDVWYYSYQTVTKYSYGTSDLIVHHSWVNQMNDGTIFCNGIYPFGFHNIVYFLHNFFGIQMLSIMRVFGVVSTLFIYLMIYVLLRKICKSRYVPFIGIFVFTLPNMYNILTNMRYQWTLPQEYAMLFLYPCAYFLIQYFERKKQEIQTEKDLKKKQKLYAWLDQYHILPSTRSLIFFAMSFSMTLAVHFYITIIAVMLCIAIAIAYFPVVLHPRYFWSIALAGILSLMSAVAPMGIAYIQGTPLEGSLRWAMSVIKGTSEESTVPSGGQEQEEASSNQEVPGEEQTTSDDTPASGKEKSPKKQTPKETTAPGIKERILSTGKKALQGTAVVCQTLWKKLIHFNQLAGNYLLNVFSGLYITFPLIYCMEGIIALSILIILFKRMYYFRNLLSVGIYTLIMVLMACAEPLHLPSLMDLARACIFLAYAFPLLCSCAVDILQAILNRLFGSRRFTKLFPVFLTCVLVFLTVRYDYVKPLSIVYAIIPSSEIKCNYDIMENYPEKTWTVVTTTNSLQIIIDKGWHMEMCTFLNGMENYTADSRVTIPSKYVFFYIEKTPLLYGFPDLVTNPLANSGYISTEAAEATVSFRGGNVYSSQNRYSLESRMYYWAKEFKKKYPQEFQIYYEDDYFICYRIVQNEYNLYNFAIDYGFNS